jgi:hypothetical protein
MGRATALSGVTDPCTRSNCLSVQSPATARDSICRSIVQAFCQGERAFRPGDPLGRSLLPAIGLFI